MAGGSGTRLWPLSRAGFPKQFLALSGHTSLFQQALERTQGLAASGQALIAPLIVGNEEHRFLMQDQIREARIEPAAIVLEPVGRNTAPALMLAASHALESAHAIHGESADPVLVVTAADQTITDPVAFTAAMQRAVLQAAEGAIVLLGITPDRPETGYGYIRAQGEAPHQQVAQFVEKPDLATAQQYLATGNYYWNASIFVLRASVWIAALERFRPDIFAACQIAWSAKTSEGQFVRPGGPEFAAVPAESIDFAVMEKCPGVLDIRMQELDAGWNDLGAWEAVWQVAQKDANGNVTVGDTILNDSTNTLVHATSRLVTVVGMDDVVVVETADAVLVARREKSQDVKKVVGQISAAHRAEQAFHRKVQRPWGWYDGIDQGPRHQVKRIMVKPGASLSLQMHHHRAEHWIVVSGTAEVTNGDNVIMLSENQSTYIPLGQTHRLRNPGRVPLEIIEVQSGGYLGEDDIVRFEDTYGRVAT
jgi:mannose-1-phosphate guanylyltransferase/mannose-6-phosphate isomerase